VKYAESIVNNSFVSLICSFPLKQTLSALNSYSAIEAIDKIKCRNPNDVDYNELFDNISNILNHMIDHKMETPGAMDRWIDRHAMKDDKIKSFYEKWNKLRNF
jgi:hypothetical protein